MDHLLMAGRCAYTTKPESNETSFQSNWCEKCSAKKIECMRDSHIPSPDESLLSGGDKGDPTVKLLQATNRRQRIYFKLLVIACFLVIVLYVVVIAALLKVWREPLSCLPSETCVSAREVREMARGLGGSRGQTSEGQLMQDLLPNDYHVVNGQYCFAGDSLLQHLVAGIGKVHGDVVASVNAIKNRQIQFLEGGGHFNSQARKDNAGSAASVRQPEVASPWLRPSSIFAHFFVKTTAAALVTDKLSLGSLLLEPQGSLSHRQGIEVNIVKGEFTVTCAGFYFLYSHVIFTRNTTETPRHLVLLKQNGSQRVLLESRGGQASNLQGVFRLQAGDVLAVAASGRLLDTSQSNRSMYIGAYRLATGQESDRAKD